MILCFGDSLTAGFGVDSEHSYPARLQRRLLQEGYADQVINAGVSGDTTAEALKRLARSMQALPAIAIVTLGANDGLQGLSLQEMENNLTRIIQHLQKAGVRVILGGMKIPPNDYDKAYTTAFAQVYPRLASAYRLPLIPFFLEGVVGEPAYTLFDGIHPNGEGYARVLEHVWKVLQPVLESGGGGKKAENR